MLAWRLHIRLTISTSLLKARPAKLPKCNWRWRKRYNYLSLDRAVSSQCGLEKWWWVDRQTRSAHFLISVTQSGLYIPQNEVLWSIVYQITPVRVFHVATSLHGRCIRPVCCTFYKQMLFVTMKMRVGTFVRACTCNYLMICFRARPFVWEGM